MSAPELSIGTVVRTESGNRGTRRLPLAQPAEAASVPDAPQQPDLTGLRITFANELAVLEEAVRAQALAEARQIAERELADDRKRLEAELSEKLSELARAQQQAMERQCAQFEALIGELQNQKSLMLEAMEPVVGRLTLAAVQRLLGRYAADHQLVADLAVNAIEQYRLAYPLQVRVSEADYRSILAGAPDSVLKTALHVDLDAAAGSCVIDFGIGQLDAGLETQLDALKKALLGVEQGSAGDVATR